MEGGIIRTSNLFTQERNQEMKSPKNTFDRRNFETIESTNDQQSQILRIDR